jgi:hypothetical protein
MVLTFMSHKIAKRLGVNKNHSACVHCRCMDDPIFWPGAFGMHRNSDRDPRRVGMWDALGVVDIRDPNAALELYRAHVAEADARAA